MRWEVLLLVVLIVWCNHNARADVLPLHSLRQSIQKQQLHQSQQQQQQQQQQQLAVTHESLSPSQTQSFADEPPPPPSSSSLPQQQQQLQQQQQQPQHQQLEEQQQDEQSSRTAVSSPLQVRVNVRELSEGAKQAVEQVVEDEVSQRISAALSAAVNAAQHYHPHHLPTLHKTHKLPQHSQHPSLQQLPTDQQQRQLQDTEIANEGDGSGTVDNINDRFDNNNQGDTIASPHHADESPVHPLQHDGLSETTAATSSSSSSTRRAPHHPPSHPHPRPDRLPPNSPHSHPHVHPHPQHHENSHLNSFHDKPVPQSSSHPSLHPSSSASHQISPTHNRPTPSSSPTHKPSTSKLAPVPKLTHTPIRGPFESAPSSASSSSSLSSSSSSSSFLVQKPAHSHQLAESHPHPPNQAVTVSASPLHPHSSHHPFKPSPPPAHPSIKSAHHIPHRTLNPRIPKIPLAHKSHLSKSSSLSPSSPSSFSLSIQIAGGEKQQDGPPSPLSPHSTLAAGQSEVSTGGGLSFHSNVNAKSNVIVKSSSSSSASSSHVPPQPATSHHRHEVTPALLKDCSNGGFTCGENQVCIPGTMDVVSHQVPHYCVCTGGFHNDRSLPQTRTFGAHCVPTPDRCTLNNGGCHAMATCTTSYSWPHFAQEQIVLCHCKSGFIGDGKHCTPHSGPLPASAMPIPAPHLVPVL